LVQPGWLVNDKKARTLPPRHRLVAALAARTLPPRHAAGLGCAVNGRNPCPLVDSAERPGAPVTRAGAHPVVCPADLGATQVLRFNAWFEESIPNDPKARCAARGARRAERG
jgi:hypothetical protein